MIQSHIERFFLAVTLVALQALIFNHIHIYGYATPFICVYFILTLPLSTAKWAKLLWGFVIGLAQDTFANTPGVMAATMTFLALIHDPLLTIVGGEDKDDKDEIVIPSAKSLGLIPFLRYAAVMILIQNTVFYLLMTFNFATLNDMLINIGGSTVLSFLIIWFIEGLRNNVAKHKK